MNDSLSSQAIVRVALGTIDGKLLVLEVPADSTVLQLKHRVAEAWGIPQACQHMIAGTTVLNEPDTLGNYYIIGQLQTDHVLSVTVLISLVSVADDLKDVEGAALPLHSHKKALKILGDLVQSGMFITDASIIRAVSAMARMPYSDVEFRIAAVELLGQIVKNDDDHTSRAVYAALRSYHGSLRLSALKVLVKIKKRDDNEAITEILACLKHPEATVRRAALQALSQLTQQCDVNLKAALAMLKNDDDVGVRQAASVLLQLTPAEEGENARRIWMC